MKSNLILRKFDTSSVPGTMNIKDIRTFFGAKVVYTEDNIFINDDVIEFSCNDNGKKVGYQYYDKESISESWETNFIENLSDLKDNYHNVSLLTQTTTNLNSNTRWRIEIDTRNILKDYLFFKFKEARSFRSINYNDLYNNSINDTIYDYINFNILKNYKFDSIDFYVLYSDIPKKQSIKRNILLQYTPEFNTDVYKSENKVSNFNVINIDEYNYSTIKIDYFQIKPSDKYKFDYYFDLNFIKV